MHCEQWGCRLPEQPRPAADRAATCAVPGTKAVGTRWSPLVLALALVLASLPRKTGSWFEYDGLNTTVRLLRVRRPDVWNHSQPRRADSREGTQKSACLWSLRNRCFLVYRGAAELLTFSIPETGIVSAVPATKKL